MSRSTQTKEQRELADIYERLPKMRESATRMYKKWERKKVAWELVEYANNGVKSMEERAAELEKIISSQVGD